MSTTPSLKPARTRRPLALLAAALVGLCSATLPLTVSAQTAPALRAVVPAESAPETMAAMFTPQSSGQRTIAVPGATWLQLQFAEVRLGPKGKLTITDASGQSQHFSQDQIDAWGGLTAVFNGSELRIDVTPGEGDTEPVVAKVKDVIIGLPEETLTATEAPTPQPMRRLLGEDLRRFIPDDVRRSRGLAPPREGGGANAPSSPTATPEAICGTTDDRVASSNPRAGRIMPIGCTGWLIDGGTMLTAGHCVGTTMQTVEFNVPASQANGTTVAPPVRDQYRIIATSIVSQNGGEGNDWAVFRVLPNTETNLSAAAAQGATFQVSNTNNPAQVRVTGYGVDGPAPNFGNGGTRDAQNQTQQTHAGALTTNTGGANTGVLRYSADTQGGNSGSPVIVEGTNTTIGIHTHGGCGTGGGTNAGTSFRHAALWTALTTAQGPNADILWQHINGTVHYWPMRDGQRQGGLNIGAAGPVGPEWRLIGTGDLNGDGTADILWQHINGTVHYWPIRNGQRQGGLNIAAAGPVGPEWRLIGAGDLNGDGTADILWQHINGTVHYWPIRNGQRMGGFDIGAAGPVGPEWRLIGAGDLNGDGTADIVWRHINGTVHFWPIRNGQRLGGQDIGGAGPVGPEWRLIGLGDLNGDRTADVLWQHINGTVHYWPIRNGQRQGGFNVGSAGPVGPEWRLIGAGDLTGN